jgi:nucleotide-binding universal stress UspA family protein
MEASSAIARGASTAAASERRLMSIKDILVHVDTTPSCEDRLALAADFAERFDARLIGVGLEDIAAQEMFGAQLAKARVIGDWHSATGDLVEFVTARAKASDLVVLGQAMPAPSALQTPEEVILGCGRPVLVAPYAWHFIGRIGAIGLVAWNGSREAARALGDALPLLAGAAVVTLFSVNPDPDDDWMRDGEFVRHLARHTIEATAETVSPKGITVAEAVLSRITDTGADILVMGAYGHSRFREIVLGSMTRDMLQRAKVPILMSH